jgi:hypothetical protein
VCASVSSRCPDFDLGRSRDQTHGSSRAIHQGWNGCQKRTQLRRKAHTRWCHVRARVYAETIRNPIDFPVVTTDCAGFETPGRPPSSLRWRCDSFTSAEYTRIPSALHGHIAARAPSSPSCFLHLCNVRCYIVKRAGTHSPCLLTTVHPPGGDSVFAAVAAHHGSMSAQLRF